MQRETPNIFLSYSRIDGAFALKLAIDLRAMDITVWIDQLDIPAGARWDREVENALQKSETVLVIVSEASANSDNVLNEISYALDQKKKVIPIVIDQTPVPLRITRLQREDFSGDYATSLRRFTEHLRPSKSRTDALNTMAEEQIQKQTPSTTCEHDDETPESIWMRVRRTAVFRIAAVLFSAAVVGIAITTFRDTRNIPTATNRDEMTSQANPNRPTAQPITASTMARRRIVPENNRGTDTHMSVIQRDATFPKKPTTIEKVMNANRNATKNPAVAAPAAHPPAIASAE